jgi:hypothetical protein
MLYQVGENSDVRVCIRELQIEIITVSNVILGVHPLDGVFLFWQVVRFKDQKSIDL